MIESPVRRLNTPVHHLLSETFYRGNRLREAVEDFRHIVDAVLAHDAVGAGAAVRQRVDNGRRFITDLDRARRLER